MKEDVGSLEDPEAWLDRVSTCSILSEIAKRSVQSREAALKGIET